MPTRRHIIFALTALAGGTVAYTAGDFRRGASQYDEVVSLRRPIEQVIST
jgi:hypothetical protein